MALDEPKMFLITKLVLSQLLSHLFLVSSEIHLHFRSFRSKNVFAPEEFRKLPRDDSHGSSRIPLPPRQETLAEVFTGMGFPEVCVGISKNTPECQRV